MDEGPEWFAPKRFGYGTGLPISWQGWAITIAYLAIVLGGVGLLRENPLGLAGLIVPATAAFVVIAARTTRGGWHWHWGSRDQD